MTVYHFYQKPGLSKGLTSMKLLELQQLTSLVQGLETEICFNVGVIADLNEDELKKLIWLLGSPFSQSKIRDNPHLQNTNRGSIIIEVGPRLNFSTPFSTNAVSICQAIGLTKIYRIEFSTRYKILWTVEGLDISRDLEEQVTLKLHDRMTQCPYQVPIMDFNHGIIPEDWFYVDVMNMGRKAIEDVNQKLGLAFDDFDMDYYTNLFVNILKRNPTSVECFDIAQSNSEHSRHWFFKGKIFVNKEEKMCSLMKMIMDTQLHSNQNNVIKFSDNSSAIKGFIVDYLCPEKVEVPSSFGLRKEFYNITFTAETHNFPTGVSPFSGAATGTGGRIRDIEAVGRGGLCIAGTAGYAVGNLLIPGYDLPWEDKTFTYPDNLASPLHILIEASNGASDYGNKFGEPVVSGYTRSFGLLDHSGQRREWVKPIMFSGGVGAVHDEMIKKMEPKKGMKVVKVGGPVYRIGVGGGSASSIQVQGDNKCELDFGAVQRGDPEMENKLNRLIRGCIENSNANPICSIHDQGAGGNGNVLKEIAEPAGAVIFTECFTKGDNSLSTLELWGAEYQESNAILIEDTNQKKLMNLAKRERCPADFVGVITGNGKVVLSEESNIQEDKYLDGSGLSEMIKPPPFNMDLELILGNMPQKEFHFSEVLPIHKALQLPSTLTITEALSHVLRLATVCSKRFLTNKVDRCVTGLIAQQQCVGPIHTPLADCAVTALSIFNTQGAATAIGEQPIKGLVNVAAGARMAVAESLTNLVFAPITELEDVKCSGNWMWAAKLPGEGANLYTACEAMCNFISELGIAVDGGKDSLSMAARVNKDTVKAPGTLVVSTYAPCPDIRKVVTPDLKGPNMGIEGALLWVRLSKNHRLGGSALAQCFSQIGEDVPDVENVDCLKKAFNLTQRLIYEKKVLAGHDISDGGLITCVLEMAFAGLSGLKLEINTEDEPLSILFSEEVGWILEVYPKHIDEIIRSHKMFGILCTFIGHSCGFGVNSLVSIKDFEKNDLILEAPLINFYKQWEETSFNLEKRQASLDCVQSEFDSLSGRKGPTYNFTFDPEVNPIPKNQLQISVRVAVLREEGTNGDREMAASLHMAGFEVWDVTMEDLLSGNITIDRFRGIIFPGGFSFGDVLGSAKGWAACLKFNKKLWTQFKAFAERQDTFSLGVCNGCQLMSLLGWVGVERVTDLESPDIVLDRNLSDRFECRFTTVRIEKSPSIMFKGMEESVLGVWVAHGEGRFTFKNQSIKNKITERNNIALTYADDDGLPTEMYPLNPNGSAGGIAGLCSSDGRFLALMPHPERCTKLWQWPYLSPNIKDLTVSPWLKLFTNAYVWAIENSVQ